MTKKQDRQKALDKRLIPLSTALGKELARANNEANDRNMFYSGQTVELKTKYWLESMKIGAKDILKKYDTEDDLQQFMKFIDAQHARITKSFEGNGFSGICQNLETGIRDLKILLEDDSSKSGNDGFWANAKTRPFEVIGLLLAVAGLAIAIIAL